MQIFFKLWKQTSV